MNQVPLLVALARHQPQGHSAFDECVEEKRPVEQVRQRQKNWLVVEIPKLMCIPGIQIWNLNVWSIYLHLGSVFSGGVNLLENESQARMKPGKLTTFPT